MGVVFGVLAIVVVSFYAKKELNKVREFIRMLNIFIFVEQASCFATCTLYIESMLAHVFFSPHAPSL